MPVEPPAELVERAAGRAAGVPGRADPPHRGRRSTSTARSCSSPAGSTRLWQATVAAGADPVAAANVIANRLAGRRSTRPSIPPELAKLVEARDRIPRAALDEALAQGRRAGLLGRRRTSRRRPSRTPPSWSRSSTRILDANPGQVAAYRGGKEGLLGFFVGQVMKETGGKANAARSASSYARAAVACRP